MRVSSSRAGRLRLRSEAWLHLSPRSIDCPPSARVGACNAHIAIGSGLDASSLIGFTATRPESRRGAVRL